MLIEFFDTIDLPDNPRSILPNSNLLLEYPEPLELNLRDLFVLPLLLPCEQQLLSVPLPAERVLCSPTSTYFRILIEVIASSLARLVMNIRVTRGRHLAAV
jgi:hypothetical protein